MLIIAIYLICFIAFFIDDEKGLGLIAFFSFPLTIYWILGILLENIFLGINAILLIPFVIFCIAFVIGNLLGSINA